MRGRKPKPAENLPDSTRRLLEIIESLGISRSEFAEKVGTTPSGLSSILVRGTEVNPRLAKAIELEFGISQNWLLWGNEEDQPHAITPKAMRCHSCRFWDSATFTSKDLPENVDEFGYCRRNAPMPLMFKQSDQDNPVQTTIHWPVTENTDFCGEWKSKNYL